MLSYKSPHALVRLPNPVFDVELRRVRRLRSAASLSRYSLAVLLVPYLALIAWWLLNVLAFAQTQGLQKFNVYRTYTNTGFELYVPIILVTLLTMLALDFYAVIVTVNTIRHDKINGQLDELRLTPITTKDYVVAKYATAQVRVWRILAWEVAARMLFVVLTIALDTFEGCWFCGYGNDAVVTPLVREVTNSLSAHPLRTLATIIVFGLLAAAYIAEPLWRMRLLTALGLAISARINNLTFGALIAFGFLVVVHIVQGYFISQLADTRVDTGVSLIKPALLIGLLAVFYRVLSLAALSFARRSAFRPD